MGKYINKDKAKNKRDFNKHVRVSARIKKHLKAICSHSKYNELNKNQGNIGFKSIILLASLMSCGYGLAQWRIVLDPKAVAQVEANTALQLAAEHSHNSQLDTILSQQKEILEKSASLAASKELALKTLENIEGFGVESMWYKQIVKTSKQIAEISPEIVSSVKNSGIENKAIVIVKVGDLSLKATQCVKDFISIVNNSKISNPLKTSSSDKNDGYNLLDRYERMTLAAQIYGDLEKIKRQLNYMLYMCESGSWADLLYTIDHNTWAKLNAGKMISDNLINQWNRIKK